MFALEMKSLIVILFLVTVCTIFTYPSRVNFLNWERQRYLYRQDGRLSILSFQDHQCVPYHKFYRPKYICLDCCQEDARQIFLIWRRSIEYLSDYWKWADLF